MSFKRHKAQLFCEHSLGYKDFAAFKASKSFNNLILDKVGAIEFQNRLVEDGKDLFFKGLQSLFEALNGFKTKNYSWGVVKFYYSVYYNIKADLAFKGIGIIRETGLYYLEAKAGVGPITKGRVKNYTTDHQACIHFNKDLFASTDKLLSQTVENEIAYMWLMQKRERINYQERIFYEPGCPDFLEFINSRVEKNKFDDLIDEIIQDNYIKTFQPEYATLAIPIKRYLQTFEFLKNSGYKLGMSKEKLRHLKKFKVKFFLNDITAIN